MNLHRNCALLAVSGVALVLAVPASAQTVTGSPGDGTANQKTGGGGPETPESQDSGAGGLAEIVVTAQKTESTLQKTPIAITVLNGPEITNQGRTTVDDVLKNVPGLEVQGAARGFVVAIRGLGSDLPPGVGESSVSTNFDGVYNIRAESGVLGFYDLDRVEVLRGPQSTLYGRNATGGVVNVISAVPKLGVTEGAVSLGGGNYDLLRGEAALNLPLGETTAIRAAVTGVTRDGYLSNGHDDQKGYGGRLKFLFKPNDDLTVLLGAEGAEIEGKGPGAVEVANFAAGQTYTTADPSVGGQRYHSYKLWSQIDLRAGPGTLTVLPAYQRGHGTVYGFFGGRGTDGDDPKRVVQKSVEVRYASNPGEPITWLAGYYHYEYLQFTTSNALNYDPVTAGLSLGDFGFTRNRGNSDAAFGQVTVALADRLRLIGGARYTWDKRTALGSGFAPGTLYQGKVDGNFFDYRAGAEFDVTDRSLLYATAASAFRPGGTNPFSGGSFKPERLHSYEVGTKNRFLANRLQINASAFYYDYSNFQVVDFFIGPTGPSLVFYNADATNYGAELEAQALLSPVDQVNVSVAYLHSRIDSDLILHPADPFTNVNFRGQRLPHSPALTVKGGYQHVFAFGDGGEITPRIDLRYVAKQFIAPNNADFATQRGYFNGDASIGWTSASKAFSLTAYLKNFTDKALKTGYFVGYLTVAAPRTYGVNLTAKF